MAYFLKSHDKNQLSTSLVFFHGFLWKVFILAIEMQESINCLLLHFTSHLSAFLNSLSY